VVPLAVIALIAWIYWPVHAAGLVWDDKTQLRDAALQLGNDWQSIFHLNFDWSNYFRPLGVALFAAETRAFDAAPAPMHLFSLGLHLVNSVLVGALARSLLAQSDSPASAKILPCLAMMLFGLHPLLVEPVVWISGQVDLLVTLFTLLGLLANLALRRTVLRATSVALCFFLAANTKEAAVSFPLLLLVVDWVRPVDKIDNPGVVRLRWALAQCLRRQWLVYLSVLAAGVVYLAFRYWGLGFLVHGSGNATSFSGSRLQLICFTYLAYWRLLIWPMAGLGPIHLVPMQQFAEITAVSLAADMAAIAIVVVGLCLFWKRKAVGGLVMGVSVALLPVVHIIPIDFEASIYHDRYALPALAIMCAFLPLVITSLAPQRRHPRRLMAYGALAGAAWLLVAMINIRVTVPLWSDELRLWQWSLRQNPGSIVAEDHLLSTYLDSNDLLHAQPIADALMKDGRSCANCMIEVAYLAVIRGDAERASLALQEAKRALDSIVPTRRQLVGYLLTTGNLGQLRHDAAGAEEAYGAAISLDPLSPDARMSLAFLQARQGQVDEARKTAEAALSLSAPDERTGRRREFERVLAASTADPRGSAVSQ
jgi:hypothetical protein